MESPARGKLSVTEDAEKGKILLRALMKLKSLEQETVSLKEKASKYISWFISSDMLSKMLIKQSKILP